VSDQGQNGHDPNSHDMGPNIDPDIGLVNFEKRAQALLQESAESLDGRTRSRLTQARHAALDAIEHRKRNPWIWWGPVSGATAAAVIATVLLLSPGRHQVEPGGLTVADEIEIVTSEDSLEFYRDVEFYSWLDTVLEDAPAEESGA
jgi:hypothetical protein